MKKQMMRKFVRAAFPTESRTVLRSLSYGVLLVALLWYPLPLLVAFLAPPKWAAYALILGLLCVALGFFLWGKPLLRAFNTVGWTAAGYLAAGIVLAVLFHGDPAAAFQRPGAVVLSGALGLLAYLAVSFFQFIKSQKG